MAGKTKFQKYLVAAGNRRGHAPTIAAAKVEGLRLGRLTERNERKWNLTFLKVDILFRSGPVSWKPTGWEMFIPVRGTGRTRDSIVAEIKRRQGVAPYTWRKRR